MLDILLIEPDSILGNTYKKVLQREGYKIDLQTDAQKAVHALDRQTPKLIILEIQLGGHNGVEFLYEIRSHPDWQNIPIIINSLIPAEITGINPVVAQQLGIKNILYKPQTTLDKLLSFTNEILQVNNASTT